MPPLRKSLITLLRRRSVRWLALPAMLLCLACLDCSRDPSAQFLGNGYVQAVRVYQAVCSPIVGKWIVCRFDPTCSEYSKQAVQKHGIVKGLRLTVKRIARCRATTPLHTQDPVP